MKLDLGCGHKKKKGFIGIDRFDWSSKYRLGEFICGEIPDCLKGFPDGSVEYVRANHFLEHLPQDRVIETMNEVYRILIPGGLFDIAVPPTPGRGAFADPTHRSFWNDLSFRYYDMEWDSGLSKSYGINCNFKKVKVYLKRENSLKALLKKEEME